MAAGLIPHHYGLTKQIPPLQLLPLLSGHLPSPPRSWAGSFQPGGMEWKIIFPSNSYLLWLQADGSVGKRHGEQGRPGTRPHREETVSFMFSVTRSAVLSQQKEEAVRSECREDKHRNRRTGGKGWRNTLGLTAWGTNTETGRVWELRLKSVQGSSRLRG